MYSQPVSTTTTSSSTGFGLFGITIDLAIVALYVVSLWKIYGKAGKPGWAAIVPIYNVVVLLQIVERPVWWIILLLIPFVNIVISIILSIDLAKAFGKSGAWGFFMLALLGIIGYPMLAFGSSTFIGKGGSASAAGPAMAPPSQPTSQPPAPSASPIASSPIQPPAPSDSVTPPPVPPAPGA